MIRLLQGTVHSQDSRTIILLVNGVGYHVFAPSSFTAKENEEITLSIHTHVREDAINLYGFRTKNELNFFEILLTINGIGPKMALEILSQPIDVIKTAVLQENPSTLTAIPGIGRKIADRMILELKNKLDTDPAELTKFTNHQTQSKEMEDAITALENLGYKRSHISRVFSQNQNHQDSTPTAESLIKYFLQNN